MDDESNFTSKLAKDMASQAPLRAAKNELRTLMKAKLSRVSPASIHEQSTLDHGAI